MPILYALATQSVATHGPVNESLLGAKKKVKKVRVTFGWELLNSTGPVLEHHPSRGRHRPGPKRLVLLTPTRLCCRKAPHRRTFRLLLRARSGVLCPSLQELPCCRRPPS